MLRICSYFSSWKWDGQFRALPGGDRALYWGCEIGSKRFQVNYKHLYWFTEENCRNCFFVIGTACTKKKKKRSQISFLKLLFGGKSVCAAWNPEILLLAGFLATVPTAMIARSSMSVPSKMLIKPLSWPKTGQKVISEKDVPWQAWKWVSWLPLCTVISQSWKLLLFIC